MEGAVTAVIDKPLGDLHCAMVFEVEGIPRIAIAEPDDSGSEGDSDQAPDLLSESSSEESSSEDSDEEEQDEEQYEHQGHMSTAAMQRIKQTLQQRKQSEEAILAERAAAVPPMVVRPTMVSATTAIVKLAVSNMDGTAPLVIRKGDAMATLTQIQPHDMHHGKAIAISPVSQEPSMSAAVNTAAIVPSVTEEVEEAQKQEKEQARIQEKEAIWKVIGKLSGQEIVKLVKDDIKLGSITFREWKGTVDGHLKFGPRTPAHTKEDLTCLLYALRLVVAVDPKKPGVMKGFEGKIVLRDPNTEPVKCHHQRYTPKERAIIQKEVAELLKNGMIEKSDSPWSAPVVLVRKKDGKWRFCVNYTATVNRFLRHDALRLPKSQDVLDSLADATMLSL